ncbi:MAG: hypothetical protein ACRC7N_06225 [Clostridium sp.]
MSKIKITIISKDNTNIVLKECSLNNITKDRNITVNVKEKGKKKNG